MLCFDHPRESQVTVSLHKHLGPTDVYDSKIRSMFLGHNQSLSAKAMLGKGFKMSPLFLNCYGNLWYATSKVKIQVTSAGCRHMSVWIKSMQEGSCATPDPIWSLLHPKVMILIDDERRSLRPDSGCAGSQKSDLEWSNTPVLSENDQ